MTEPPPPEFQGSECTICSHPDAALIDEQLLSGTALRAVAGTHHLSRSSVHRHRQNHLSVQTITDQAADDAEQRPGGLRLVDVHRDLAALADRLEKVVELATRTRKPAAAVTAMRELRQTLTAIADVQAKPELRDAASLEHMQASFAEEAGHQLAQLLDFTLRQFGVITNDAPRTSESAAVASVLVGCLEEIQAHGSRARFVDVDTRMARDFMEARALERAGRIEDEVERRVEAELRRREAQARPALEATPQPRAIEAGVTWSA